MQMQKAANAKASKCVSWNTLEYECYNCNGPESRSRETMVFEYRHDFTALGMPMQADANLLAGALSRASHWTAATKAGEKNNDIGLHPNRLAIDPLGTGAV